MGVAVETAPHQADCIHLVVMRRIVCLRSLTVEDPVALSHNHPGNHLYDCSFSHCELHNRRRQGHRLLNRSQHHPPCASFVLWRRCTPYFLDGISHKEVHEAHRLVQDRSELSSAGRVAVAGYVSRGGLLMSKWGCLGPYACLISPLMNWRSGALCSL